ncbi:hypothetical protein JHK87_016909 [Glycine soja]|nr:hypothetical protein JHK87_016909 [Glycine soja]
MSTPAPPPSAVTATVGLGYGIAIAVSILVLISTIMLASYACVRIKANVIIITRHRHNHSINNNNNNNNNSSFRDASDGPGVVVLGMEKPAIETCYGPKIVIGESKRLPRPSDQGPCAICLSEYLPKETIRCVPECRHCFHAECIDEWLKMSATCPLCRNSPVPSPLPTPAATPLSELVPLAFDAREPMNRSIKKGEIWWKRVVCGDVEIDVVSLIGDGSIDNRKEKRRVEEGEATEEDMTDRGGR